MEEFIEIFESSTKRFKIWKEWGITLEGYGEQGVVTFIADDMDIAIKAGFTFFMDGDEETHYLETIDGRDIAVPKSKLQN